MKLSRPGTSSAQTASRVRTSKPEQTSSAKPCSRSRFLCLYRSAATSAASAFVILSRSDSLRLRRSRCSSSSSSFFFFFLTFFFFLRFDRRFRRFGDEGGDDESPAVWTGWDSASVVLALAFRSHFIPSDPSPTLTTKRAKCQQGCDGFDLKPVSYKFGFRIRCVRNF